MGCRGVEKACIQKYYQNDSIDPGGSIVYLEKLMKILKNSSLIIFLDVLLEIIEKRLINKATRGIVVQIKID